MNTELVQLDVFGLRIKRDVTIENFRGLGKLILLKGTRVNVSTGLSNTDGAGMLVDAYVRHDAVFYGVRVDADDLESVVDR